MWQLLLAAVAAGSTGFAAKHLFKFGSSSGNGDRVQNDQQSNPFDDFVKYQGSPFPSREYESGCEINCENSEGIFRFSSPGSGSGSGSKNVRKKKGVGAKKVENEKKRSGGVEISRRRVAVCLKKRRTSKKCDRPSSSKDSSLFNWGLSIGIMYMMSAGQAEISKLKTNMDETAKVVQELRSELHRKKSSQCVQDSKAEKLSGTQTQQVLNNSRNRNGDFNFNQVVGFPQPDEGGCDSVLTEERDQEVMDMDHLEAELESELQKLHWSAVEAIDNEDTSLNLLENFDHTQSFGVSPTELKNKLSHLLIEQQENQIVGLESELHSAHSKLNEKETELQALKDCIKRLTEFSLSAASDGEEVPKHECSKEWDNNNQTERESIKSVVGMKRPSIDIESCHYFEK